MSNVKEIERAELHKTIWRIANDLRGSVDGWDFKSYVLGMLFYRFISENLVAYLNDQEHRAGSSDFDYASLSDDRLDASIRYFGQAGSPVTARAAEMLTDLMMARMVRLLGVSRSERQ